MAEKKITEITHSVPFGDFFVMDQLRREDGTYPRTIVIGTRGSGGLRPRQLRLPHQLYVHTVQEILAESDDTEVFVHPIYEEGFYSNWTQVELPEGLEKLPKKNPRTDILPGDLVEHVHQDLDPREVLSVGKDWLTLDLLGTESPRLPLANYRIDTHREARR